MRGLNTLVIQPTYHGAVRPVLIHHLQDFKKTRVLQEPQNSILYYIYFFFYSYELLKLEAVQSLRH